VAELGLKRTGCKKGTKDGKRGVGEEMHLMLVAIN